MRILSWPNLTQLAFAIRDDDVSFFTPPEIIETLYRNAFDKGFKVSFGVIPIHKATNDPSVPPRFRGKNTFHAINVKKELTGYLLHLLEHEHIDLVQHGCFHEGSSKCPELLIHKKDAREIIRLGKMVLEQTFNRKMKVFVPPWEFLTFDTWKEVARENLSLCMTMTNYLRCVPILFSDLRIFPKLLAYAITKRYHFAAESVEILNVMNISPLYHHYTSRYADAQSAHVTFDNFKILFESIYARNGCLILDTHYWQYFEDWEEEITRRLLKKYYDFIFDYVDRRPRIWKVGLSELIKRLKLMKTLLIRRKADGAIICTPHKITGLTLKLSAHERISSHQSNLEYLECKNEGSMCVVLDTKPGQKIRIIRQ